MPKKPASKQLAKPSFTATCEETLDTSLASLTKSSTNEPPADESFSNPFPLSLAHTFSTPQKVSAMERHRFTTPGKAPDGSSQRREPSLHSPIGKLNIQIDTFMAHTQLTGQDTDNAARAGPPARCQPLLPRQQAPDRFYPGHTQTSCGNVGGNRVKAATNSFSSKDTLKGDAGAKTPTAKVEHLGKRLVKGITFKQDITAKSQPNSLIFTNSLRARQTYQPQRGGFKISARTMAILEEAKERGQKRVKASEPEQKSTVDEAENLSLVSEEAEGSDSSSSESSSEGDSREELPRKYRSLGEKLEALDSSIRQLREVKQKHPLFSEATRLVFQVMRL